MGVAGEGVLGQGCLSIYSYAYMYSHAHMHTASRNVWRFKITFSAYLKVCNNKFCSLFAIILIGFAI